METEVDDVRIVLAAGTTRTAAIEGISAAGADPAARAHTPSADAEVLVYGRPVRAPMPPVSPTGCPTPAVISRAVRELVGTPVAVVDAGLAAPTGAPTVDVGASPGGDVREDEPVPGALAILDAAREFGRELPDEEVFVAETIPGGTTTALGVLRALDAGGAVSSSLPSNPLERKREVVDAALAVAPFDPPAGPVAALRHAGDPVLAAAAGVTAGALAAGTDVTLAGGTQLLAVAALVRALSASAPDGPAGRHDGRLRIATTPFVADDPNARFRETAADLGLDATVTDPGFDGWDHRVAERYRAGEAKEGVGMGGALALADRAGVPTADVRERIAAVYDRLLDEPAGARPDAVPGGDA